MFVSKIPFTCMILHVAIVILVYGINPEQSMHQDIHGQIDGQTD